MNVYSSLEAQLHDAFWEDEESPEADWLASLLKSHPGKALEIGCGSGRLLLPLLKLGHQVEGIDNSPEMLELCRTRAEESGLTPMLHEGDMGTFSTTEPYASILVPAFTLQLADDPTATLSNFRSLLVPGGLLYLTVFIPLAEIHRELPEGEWYPDHETVLPDGRHASVQTRHTMDRKNRVLHREHHYRLVDEDREIEHFSKQSVRWFTPRDLQKLLIATHFEPETAVADFDEKVPVDEHSQIITLIARAVVPSD